MIRAGDQQFRIWSGFSQARLAIATPYSMSEKPDG